MTTDRTILAISSTTFLEVSPFTFVTDASDIGLKPGQVPNRIHVEDDGGMFCNGLALILERVDRDGTITYRQQFGCVRLRVFND